MRHADILVVGAGPTGLALALQAHDHGARVRIVERRPEARRPSRALIVYPRTLEVLRPLGVTDRLLACADTAPEVHLHTGRRGVARLRLADFALDDTAFPHLSLLRQMDVEIVLAEALADRGVEVERGTECMGVSDWPEGVCATLESQAGIERMSCSFVAGCDGAASIVRTDAGIGWRGGTYAHEIVLADAELEGDLAHGVAHVAAGRRGLLFAFALGERAAWRLLASRPAVGEPLPSGRPGPPAGIAELQAMLNDLGLDARVTCLGWSDHVRLQHRLAGQFRRGRLYLVGDAAHTFSPAAGQGMNTGIQDAANLGWKLAFALSGTARPALLDSYERERRPVARRRLALTHLAFWAEASTSLPPSLLRAGLVRVGGPWLPTLMGRRRLVAEGVRLLSQLRVNYRRSPLSVEGEPSPRGRPRVGDRLPDATVTCAGRTQRLHELLARPGVHILHQGDADIASLGRVPHVTTHQLTSVAGRELLVVRPDGYIGLRSGVANVRQVRAWLSGIGLS